MSALRERLIAIDARLSRIGAWPWAVQNGCVVAPAERASSIRRNPEEFIDDLEYYGGELVCESVSRPRAELIAAAPADLAYLVDVTTHLVRERDRVRHLMYEYGIRHRSQIDAEIRARGAQLFTLSRAELPRWGAA